MKLLATSCTNRPSNHPTNLVSAFSPSPRPRGTPTIFNMQSQSSTYPSGRRRSMTPKTAGNRRSSGLWKRRDGFSLFSPSRSLLSHAFILRIASLTVHSGY
ncbi:hypothetical protein ACN47E_008216 [Coniothyrium glycines]